jgi:hypothetical protein
MILLMIQFLLVHDGRNEDTVRVFFLEVHEIFVKHSLNPFTDVDAAITSPAFDKRVRALAKRL